MGLVVFLLVLSILVFFHELGHFSVAKLLGVKVYVFSIGFGKMLFEKEYKGTKWRFSLIPLGGYVKMKGQEDLDPSLINKDPDSYQSKTPFERILILLAGPFANFILAFVLYIAIGILGVNALSPTIGKILPNSPAAISKLKKGDLVIKIDNHNIKTWNDLSGIIKMSKQTLTFYVKRDNLIYPIKITPNLTKTKNIFGEDIKKKMVGISPAPKIITIKYSFFESIEYAYNKTYESSKMIFQGMGKLIQGVIPANQLGGVISIGTVISNASETGIVALLLTMALISVNLGVLNLLPIPALDGGHIMFNFYEMISKKAPNKQVLITLTVAGWIILFSLMLFGVYNDINRILLPSH